MAPTCWAAPHFWASFVLLVIAGAMMYAPYGPFFAYLAESLPANVAGGAIALINSMGALGSFVGAYGVGVLNGITGSPGASYLMMAAALIVSAAITYMLPRPPRYGLTSAGVPSSGQSMKMATVASPVSGLAPS